MTHELCVVLIVGARLFSLKSPFKSNLSETHTISLVFIKLKKIQRKIVVEISQSADCIRPELAEAKMKKRLVTSNLNFIQEFSAFCEVN